MRGSFFTLSLAVFLLGTVSCELQVWSPPDLLKDIKANLPISLAPFGSTPFGKSMTGNLAVADPEHACHHLKHLASGQDQTFMIAKWDEHICHPVVQALNAQKAGAKMLILIYNQKQRDGKDINITDIEIHDNGNGNQVKIPTIAIEKGMGDRLFDWIKAHPEATASASVRFVFPAQTNKVRYSLWMSSANKGSREFLKAFHKFHNLLGGHVEFTPKYIIHKCFDCDDGHGHTVASVNCLSGGRYCAPDHGPHGISDGREVVREDLRQACIMQTAKDKFYNYIIEFDNRKECLEFKDDKCSYAVMSQVGIDGGKVKDCYTKSFNGTDELVADNTILSAMRDHFQAAGPAYPPVLQINGITYHGDLKYPSEAFNMMCSAMRHPPEICEDYHKVHDSNNSGYWALLIVITIILVLFLICMVLRYKSSLREEMMRHMESQVSTQVSQYYAMKGDGAKAST